MGFWDSSANAARMVIDTSGNVGIGTTAPNTQLTVAGSSSNSANISLHNTYSGSRQWNWFVSGGAGSGGSPAADGVMGFWDSSANAARMVIDTSGNLGVGVIAPSYSIQAAGQVAGSGAYVNTSDIRLKKNVEPIDYNLSDLMKLKPVSFDWKEQDQTWKKKRQLGLIAQDVERIIPEVVSTADDTEKTKGIAYGSLIPVLIKAVQELKTQNDDLKVELGELRKAVHFRTAHRVEHNKSKSYMARN